MFVWQAALLREACSELVDELTERAAAPAPQETPTYTGAGIAEVFSHAGAHQYLYRLVLSGEGGAIPRTEMITALPDALTSVLTGFGHRQGREPKVPMPAITTAVVGALLLTIELWLSNDLEGTPTDLATLFIRSQANGLEWALGFDHDELLFEPHVD